MNISINVATDKLENTIQYFDNLSKNLNKRMQEFITELANEGMQIASVKFSEALYSGTNDVTVEVEEQGNQCVAVVATGSAVLFIEFGTGVKYPDDHPEASANGFVRGTYGQGRGASPKGWFYKGELGNLGEPPFKQWMCQKGLVHTYGNPANMSMYNTSKEMRDKIQEVAERVFK